MGKRRKNNEEIVKALGDGDPERVRALIKTGANIRYKRKNGYDALIDAVHSRDILKDSQLLELLALLVEHGVDLSGVSSYGESGLRVLSRIGRFDAIRLLLQAGADERQLEWTPLIKAVTLGSLADVYQVLQQGVDLEARDTWSRTAWLISLLMGDIEKATLLREHGADTTAPGRCTWPPLFYALEGRHPNVVRWLIQSGADVHAIDDFGTTPLMEAVQQDDIESVDLLLQAGADIEVNANGTALARAQSRAVIQRLLDAGADPAEISEDGKRVLLGLADTGDSALAHVLPDDFRRWHTRVFATANPERMHVPFWEAMIRSGLAAYAARNKFAETCGPVTQPVWCAQRFGQSLTFLPDGRAIQIGGEHEDYYDADFCIYNDVFVYERDGSIAVYGYPQALFPPTDFHTATLIGDFIYVIGSAGYREVRQIGTTLVFRLHVPTLRFERIDTTGDAPGAIYKHRAIATNAHEIRVWKGTTITRDGDNEAHNGNVTSFVLDLDTAVWRREDPQPEG